MPIRPERGFTLLELLVAFVILSVAVATLLHAFSQSLRNTALAEDYTLATLHAQSLLAQVGVEPPLMDGVYQGAFNEQFEWQVAIERYVDPEAPADIETLGSTVNLYHVEVRVSWADGPQNRQIELQTLRLAWEEP
jgi:general secretion pathway protein I